MTLQEAVNREHAGRRYSQERHVFWYGDMMVAIWPDGRAAEQSRTGLHRPLGVKAQPINTHNQERDYGA